MSPTAAGRLEVEPDSEPAHHVVLNRHEVVPDVARGLDVRATVQGDGVGEPESFRGRKLEPTV